jgi:DNA-binding transcriptional LysR family regulator
MSEHIPFNALRSFEAVVRHGSFTRAAEELHVTQSAVSHQVKQLEAWLGSSLIDRETRAPRATPQGELLATVLANAFSDILNACRRARENVSTGSIVIAVIPSVATCWLIPKMSGFRQLYPEISTRIIYAFHGHQIDFSDVDVAIIYATTPPRLPGKKSTRLFSGESAPVCSRTFLDLHGPLDSVEQIGRATLLHDTNMQGWRQWFVKASGLKVVPRDGPIYEDFNLLRAATLAGQGISLCPVSIIRDDLTSDRLVQLSDVTVLADTAYYLIEPQQARPGTTAYVQHFLDWLHSQSLASGGV